MRASLLALVPLCVASCAARPGHPLAGEWVRPAKDGPLGTFLVLRDDRTFTMGDIQDGKRFAGISGVWRTENDRLTLAVRTSESCKVREGQQICWRYRLLGGAELELADPGAPGKALFRRSHAPGG